jgi:hypothetical protein
MLCAAAAVEIAVAARSDPATRTSLATRKLRLESIEFSGASAAIHRLKFIRFIA